MKRALLFSTLAFALVISLGSLHTHYVLDDALIYARYVRNALQGDHLYFNENEPWNALSSPLYGVLLYFSSSLLGDILLTQRILSILFFCTSIFSGVLFLRELKVSAPVMVLFTLLIASSQYFYMIFGMESYLFLTLFLYSLVHYVRLLSFEQYLPLKGSLMLTITLTLLVLTRGEGILLVTLLAIYHFWNRRPLPSPILWGIPIGAAILFISIHLYIYDTLLPQTLGAKMAQGSSGYWGGRFAFLKGIKMYTWFFGEKVSLIFLVAVAASVFSLYKFRQQIIIQFAVMFLLILMTFYTVLKIPFYHWYYAPFIYMSYLWLALLPESLLKSLRAVPRLSKYVSGAAILLLIYVIGSQTLTTYDFVKRSYTSPYKTIGKWLSKHTEKNAKVASVEVGALGWYAQRYLIDILGLTSPENARFLAARKMTAWSHIYNPDYMVIHEPLWPQESAARRYLKLGGEKITQGIPEGFAIIKIKKNSQEKVQSPDMGPLASGHAGNESSAK